MSEKDHKKRAFLRWKVSIDHDLQSASIKRFAVYARINHAVAIYRLRWILERDRIRKKYEQKNQLKKNLQDFLDRANKIKREVYSNKNQYEYTFRKIKNQWLYDQKVKAFGKKIGEILGMKKRVKEGLDRIQKYAYLRTEFVKRLVDRSELKKRRALERLRNYNLRALLEKSRLM